ncbi:TonB-dependent receptor [Cellvibrio zantedeschiae]|uniref:TonB-dependent receptor n=1 Tax=Cellvibrio zantedeschiae TaxID=1237077 RepID=A0ABQ3BA78_9GAMM|nr:TonB-dependent receptor [Cellvibrio zantedeschiae]GGY86194.1 TonB-dependent receptor [Cellvibrio zantedeschiae]
MSNKFKINPLVLAMAVAMPTTVFAQDDQVEEIVVSGFRASQAKALDAKRDATGSVDAIMASDIAEFPDNNLAESLQRIPGVAITRSGGEGRNISVRGLSAQYTRIRINGMETSTTTGGTDATGGNNRGRSFDFNVFSSDLFSSLVVHKTGSADVDEGSLGATVDMRAPRPFDKEGFVFTANGQLGYNDLSKEQDPAGGFLISNTFADGKFGALFSYSYGERSILDQGTSTVRWSNAAAEKFGKYKGTTVLATDALTTAFHPRIPRYDSYETNLSREGMSASLQFRPTDATEISFDALKSNYEATRKEKFLEASMNGNQNASVNILDYEIQGNSLVYATMTGARLLAESREDNMTTDYSMYTLSGKHDFSDRFRIDAMIGKSRSDFDNPIQNTIIMQANNQNLTWDYRNGDARITVGDSAFVPASWSINSVRQRPQATENNYDAANFNLGFDVNDTFTLKAGAARKKFEFNTWQEAYLGGEGLGTAANCALTGNTTATNTASPSCGVNLLQSADLIVKYDSGLGQDVPWLLPNRALVMDTFKLWDKPMTTAESSTARSSTFDVTEETDSEYVQVEFKTELAGLPFRGDFGVRHFSTDQKSSGWVQRNKVWVQEYVTRSYSDTLPSINLVLEPTEDVLIRAAYSEGIARSNMGNLTNDTNVTYTGTNRAITINNPNLMPSKAKSYDLGVEWYFAPESALGFALFRKDVDTFVQTVPDSLTFAQLGLSADLAVAACGTSYGANTNCNENLPWGVSRPANAPGGVINGYEINYQQPFTFLPGFWQNFGFIGSFTHVSSDMDYITASTTTTGGTIVTTQTLTNAPLLSLSPNASSATIYYEKDAFKARISVAKRDGYLTLAVKDSNSNYQNGTNGTTNVDAQVSYDFNDHFKVTLDMLNLTNEIDDQWVESTEPRLSYVHETGRQFNLGVNYKF